MKFNNAALYMCKDDSDNDMFGELYWKMGIHSFESFFRELLKCEGKSLCLTKEVLKTREHLEATLQGLQQQIQMGLARMNELKQLRLIITRHEVSINQNKNFTCMVKKTKQNKVDLAGTGQFVTNCLKCNMTCHFPCQVSKDDEKYKCAAMNKPGDPDSTCSNCPGKCSWKQHVNNSYRFELYDEYETTTLQEIKNLYDTSVGEKCRTESMLTNIQKQIEQLNDTILKRLAQAQQTVKRLEEIALKPSFLTEVEYLDLLIQSEEQEKKAGYQNRISYYKTVRMQAVTFAKLKHKMSGI